MTGLTIEKGDLVPLRMMRIKDMCVVHLFAPNKQYILDLGHGQCPLANIVVIDRVKNLI